MIEFSRFKVLTFDCYGTLIDWDSSISELVQPWLSEISSQVPPDLVVSAFALMQAKHQQTHPTLLYPEVLRRSWRDIENQFGWDENPDRADEFARCVPHWHPFADTVESLRYLSQHFAIAILSNVDNASLAGTLKMLEVPFLFTVTAEDVGSYKPEQPHFDAAVREAAEHGMSRGEILHVAQSKHHDIFPGNRLGLTTVWVDRRHGKKGTGATLAATATPTLTVNSLAELVDLHKSTRSKASPLASAR
jgi:2-haloacid dehalogenase